MHKILFASAAAVLLTGSLANAQFLLGQDENGHKQVTNLWAEQTQPIERHAAWMAEVTYAAPGGAFLLSSSDNDQKVVINTYGPRRSAARITQDGMSIGTSGAGGVSPGFLLGEDANGSKRVVNQYAR